MNKPELKTTLWFKIKAIWCLFTLFKNPDNIKSALRLAKIMKDEGYYDHVIKLIYSRQIKGGVCTPRSAIMTMSVTKPLFLRTRLALWDSPYGFRITTTGFPRAGS